MRDIDDMMALVNVEELRKLKNENKKRGEVIDFHQEVFKNIELFLTYWYEQSTEFGKIKDNFNQMDKFPCEIRVNDNGRVKVKMDNPKK